MWWKTDRGETTKQSQNGFQIIFREVESSIRGKKKKIVFNTMKEGAWKEYYRKSNVNYVLDEAVESHGNYVNKLMSKIDKTMTSLKYSCFGKVSACGLNKDEKEFMKLQKLKQEGEFKDEKEKRAVDVRLAEALEKANNAKFQKEIESLKSITERKGKSASVFKLKERVLGTKSIEPEAVTLKDPDTGLLIDSPRKIKEASLNYCSSLLTNRAPKSGYEDIVKRKADLHDERMKEIVPNDLNEMTEDQFNEALKVVASKHPDKYKYILRGGSSLKNAIFQLFSVVWRKESIPDSWYNTELVQLPKNGSDKNSLENFRFIHCKQDIPKLFSQIVTQCAKDDLISNMTKFQIATKPGHRASEHVYCIMSLMQLSEKNRSAYILNLYDIQKYFDRESAIDCHFEMYKRNVKGKVYRLMYGLNENIRIRVRTPLGLTDSRDTFAGIGQGTVSGAIVSASGLDSGVEEYFHKKEEKKERNDDEKEDEKEDDKDEDVVRYDDIEIFPLLFQDDLNSVNKSVKSAQETNVKMEELMESKLLDLNLQKSCFLIVGNGKERKKLQKEVDKYPLLLYGQRMKQATVEKYLGFQLSYSASASVAATVAKRYGVALRAIYEARAVVEDSRVVTLGARWPLLGPPFFF